MNELISIIIPVYNVQDYIRRCLDSILAQTYDNLEILLIDDGSTDKSGTIADEYSCLDDRIKVFHKKNTGLSAARNYGIQRAKGEYIAFIDSDDYVSEYFIEILYNLIQKYGAQISVCSYVHGENCRFPSQKRNKVFCIGVEECLKTWHGKWRSLETVVWNKLYHKSIFEGAEEVFPKGKIHEDILTTHLLVANCKKIVFTTEKLYAYVIRKGSLVNGKVSVMGMNALSDAQERRMAFFYGRGYEQAYIRLLIGSQKYRIIEYCKALKLLKNLEQADKEWNRFCQRYEELMQSKECNVVEKGVFYLFHNMPKQIAWGYSVCRIIKCRFSV